MACRGCAQVGDCACVVVGDGSAITVSGGGGSNDPYVVSFNETDWIDGFPEETIDNCDPDALFIAKLGDGTVALVPAPGRCAVIL